LRTDALDTVEGEDYQGHDGNGPPPEFVDHSEGKDAAEEGEDLFLVNSSSRDMCQ
jgi:hypothetical protein